MKGSYRNLNAVAVVTFLFTCPFARGKKMKKGKRKLGLLLAH